MALNYNILDYKRTLKTEDGEEYIDLMSDTYKRKECTGTFLIVNKHYVARPDLISLAVYGDDKYADLLCKVNGISNPFELGENNTVFIPDVEFLTQYAEGSVDVSEKIKDTKTDLLASVNTGNQKRRDERRTSNEQVIGETNYTIDRSLGIVFY